jgi:hypothetical protein
LAEHDERVQISLQLAQVRQIKHLQYQRNAIDRLVYNMNLGITSLNNGRGQME